MKTLVFTLFLIGYMLATTTARTHVRIARQTQNIAECIRTCPTATSEYNPVCGDNGRTYDNPSKLACARDTCGVTVAMRRRGNCDNFD